MRKRASASLGTQREMAWRNRLARFAASKLTVEAFCLGEAVSVASFYGWRTRLRNSRGNALTVPRTMLVAASSPFIDLGSVSTGSIRLTGPRQAPTTDYTPAAIDIRLDLGGGVVLHIARH